jgi:restriction system protein
VEPSDLPPYKDFLLSVLHAVRALGGTAHAKEISAWMVEQLALEDDAVAVEYPNRPGESVLLDRMAWARSYDKLGGLVETPQRGLYVLSAEGRRVLSLPEAEARHLVDEMDREIRRARSRQKPKPSPEQIEPEQVRDPEPLGSESEAEADSLDLKAALLARLHAMTPRGFEDFVAWQIADVWRSASDLGDGFLIGLLCRRRCRAACAGGGLGDDVRVAD